MKCRLLRSVIEDMLAGVRMTLIVLLLLRRSLISVQMNLLLQMKALNQRLPVPDQLYNSVNQRHAQEGEDDHVVTLRAVQQAQFL